MERSTKLFSQRKSTKRRPFFKTKLILSANRSQNCKYEIIHIYVFYNLRKEFRIKPTIDRTFLTTQRIFLQFQQVAVSITRRKSQVTPIHQLYVKTTEN